MTPAADAIRAQLERVSASSAFANSHRLNRFLRFVVERTLAGESERLKEYLIGVEVFDRDQQYDPRVDSIVRVEAGRLRTKLDEYYRDAGQRDPVVISLQRGTYAPAFAERAAAEQPGVVEVLPTDLPARIPQRARFGAVAFILFMAATLAWLAQQPREYRTTIAVLPLVVTATTDVPLAQQLTMGISAELVREGSLGVAASASARNLMNAGRTMRDIAKELHADLLLQGNVRVEGSRELRVEVVLVDGQDERKFWVESFTGNQLDVDTLERRIAAAVATAALTADP